MNPHLKLLGAMQERAVCPKYDRALSHHLQREVGGLLRSPT
jgi:hypothetical protein